MADKNEYIRMAERVAGLVQPGLPVTLEGAPLYAGQPWGDAQRIGDEMLHVVADELRARGHSPIHIAMIDNFTTGQSVSPDVFTRHMRERPYRVRFESEFVRPAEDYLEQLRSERKTISYGGEWHLTSGHRPRLTVRSGRVSCELADACHQYEKGEGTHILFHHTPFIDQQLGMGSIWQTMKANNLFRRIVTVFFKERTGAISRILVTEQDGSIRYV